VGSRSIVVDRPHKMWFNGMVRGSYMVDRIRNQLEYDPDSGLFTYLDKPIDPSYTIILGRKIHPDDNVYIQVHGWLAHRLAWYLYYGVMPRYEIDHINGDKGDNRIENLREVTPSQNIRYSKQRHLGGYYGRR